VDIAETGSYFQWQFRTVGTIDCSLRPHSALVNEAAITFIHL